MVEKEIEPGLPHPEPQPHPMPLPLLFSSTTLNPLNAGFMLPLS